jgi:hypothetical protein
MTQLQKLGLIAGLALASATALPQSSHAQSGLPVIASGSWSGTEYWISFTYTENGPVESSSGSGIADFSYYVNGSTALNSYWLTMTFNGPLFSITGSGTSNETSFSFYDGPIASNGGFTDLGSSVIANIDYGNEVGYSYATFQSDPISVPEPSSIVLAAFAVLMIAMFACIRTGRNFGGEHRVGER